GLRIERCGLAWPTRVVYFEAGGVAEVGGGGADAHGVAAGGDGELVAVLVVVGQIGGGQAGAGVTAFPRPRVPLWGGPLLFGPVVGGWRRDEVELGGGRAGPGGGVLDLGGNGCLAADRVVGRVDVRDGETPVGQAVAEGEQRPLPGGVVPPVADIESLLVMHDAADPRVMAGRCGGWRGPGGAR